MCSFYVSLSVCSSRTQSVPSFSSATSLSSAPLSSFSSVPPSPPAPKQFKGQLRSVGQPDFLRTRPTSLPSASETGIGADGSSFILTFYCSVFTGFLLLSFQHPGRANGDPLNVRPLSPNLASLLSFCMCLSVMLHNLQFRGASRELSFHVMLLQL